MNLFHKVSSIDLDELLVKLKDILAEIARTRPNLPIPRYLLHPAAATVYDRNNPMYWSEGLADTLASGKLKIRPYRTKGGWYQIKILYPKVNPNLILKLLNCFISIFLFPDLSRQSTIPRNIGNNEHEDCQ
jgi:hypothetical protein